MTRQDWKDAGGALLGCIGGVLLLALFVALFYGFVWTVSVAWHAGAQ